VDIKIFKQSDPEYLLALILRYKILRIPLGLTFSRADLARDKDDIHIGVFDKDNILATLVLTDMKDGSVKMRQVAVEGAVQGSGLGKKIIAYADGYARDKGYKLIHCHARATAKGFYLKQGYKSIGDEFTEVGIKHYYMEKKL
jgi:predicted GNAT family N-acyltransferase